MMALIARREFKGLLAQPSSWVILAGLQFLFAWFLLARLDAYLQVQAQFVNIINAPGATLSIAAPLFGTLALLGMLLVPLFTRRLIAEERRNQTLPLLLAAPVSAVGIVLGKFLGLSALLAFLAAAISAMVCLLALGTALDFGLIAANALGLLLLFACYSALGLYLSSLTRHPFIAATATSALLFGLWLLDFSGAAGGLRALAPSAHFQSFNNGLIASTDMLYFLLSIAVLLWLSVRRLDMRPAPALHWHLLALLLPLAAAIGLYALVARHPWHWDVTQNAQNSLSASSQLLLRQLKGPVRLTLFLRPQENEPEEVRRLVQEFVARYQRYKPDITLRFVDPAKEPELTRQANIRRNGELLVEYGGRSERLSVLNEAALSSVLLGLAHREDEWVMYLTGHGERNLEGIANHDLGDFGARLKQNGYRLAGVNLGIAPEVPENARLLLLTHPQVPLLPGETQKLLRFVERGGNLLWLIDAEPLRGLEPLAERLGLQLPEGRVMDPAAQQLNVPPDWTIGTGYPPHDITRDFNLITVFPQARALLAGENQDWQVSTVVEGARQGWISRSAAATRFDARRDLPGPVTLVLALERRLGDRMQRIAVVGSGAFLANSYVGNGGNLDLGVNLVNWLSEQEALITTLPRATPDLAVTLSRTQLTAISLGLIIVLPLLLLLTGAALWWRLRR